MISEACRVCGCTELNPCVDEVLSGTCLRENGETCTVCARFQLAVARLKRTDEGKRALLAVAGFPPLNDREAVSVLVLLRGVWGERSGLFVDLLRRVAEQVR